MIPTMDEVMEVVSRHAPKGFAPKLGIILGSGLSSIADQIENAVSIPYQAIPGLQTNSGVQGHAAVLMMGTLAGVPIVCLRGRLHLYEGTHYSSIQILIRIVKRLGCRHLLITCAAGSLIETVGPGELMLLEDHINFHPGNPLVGANDESIGPRFFGMEDAYDLGLQDIMLAAAAKLAIPLTKGVYISTLGPSFETPAEIRAFKRWGADLVGMSVVPEVIIARHCGLRVAGLAAITNLGAGMSNEKITHEGTLHFGEIAARNMTKLALEFVKESQNAVD
jgi:xanthosine phosphorylase